MMDVSRAKQLINSSDIDVYCKNNKVVIKSVDTDSQIAKIQNLSTSKLEITPIADLSESGVINK